MLVVVEVRENSEIRSAAQRLPQGLFRSGDRLHSMIKFQRPLPHTAIPREREASQVDRLSHYHRPTPLAVGLAAALLAAAVASPTAARGETVKSAPDAVIFRGDYPGWPWVAATPSRRIVCTWREGRVHEFSAEGRLMLSTSDDAGATWSTPRVFFDTPDVDDRNVAVLCLSDDDWLVSFNTLTETGASRTCTLRTADAGRTWSQPATVCDRDARTRAAVVRLRSGALLLPFYQGGGEQALVGLSRDDGGSWQIVEVPNAPGFLGDEWDALELADGRLVGLFRNNAPPATPADRGWLYAAESRDGGLAWSVPQRTNLRDRRATSPPQLFLHQGRPAALYDDRRFESVSVAATDDPQLLRWNAAPARVCYQYRADGQPIRDGGYPSSVPIGADRRLVVDYVHQPQERAIVGYVIDLR